MKNPYKGRRCSCFHCDKKGDRYCCADCLERKRGRCRNPCLNDPARCGLEDIRDSLGGEQRDRN